MAKMRPWDATLESEAHALVVTICGSGAAADRDHAWHELLTQIAPLIEYWAATSAGLRRAGLVGEDEPRAVLVGVIERTSRNDFANLRSYLAHQLPDPAEHAEAAMVEGLARLIGDADPAPPVRDELTGTPLRGWLFALTRFVVKEHVMQRLGSRTIARWSATVDATPSEALLAELRTLPGVVLVIYDAAAMQLAIDHRPSQAPSGELERALARHDLAASTTSSPLRKRDLESGAERLELTPEIGERPPLSTLLGVRRALAEIRAHIEEFPSGMRSALGLWLDDDDFDTIAVKLELPGPGDARALVRAGTARLRERFRGSWPELFGSP